MEKINFVNNTTPALNATNLNKLQDNVEDAIQDAEDTLQDNIDSLNTNKLEKTSVKTTTTSSTTDTYCCNYINNLGNYSTTEKVIGKWINGKPLYQKTFDKTLTPSLNSNTEVIKISTELPNANLVWLDESASYIYISNQYLALNWYANSSDYIRTWVYKSNDMIATKGTALTNAQYIVTVKYTKTTD